MNDQIKLTVDIRDWSSILRLAFSAGSKDKKLSKRMGVVFKRQSMTTPKSTPSETAYGRERAWSLGVAVFASAALRNVLVAD
jgi:hypothetical protein